MSENTRENAPNRVVPGLGDRIRAAVDGWGRRHGLARGQFAFAKKAGISDSALGEYGREETEPGAYAIWRIADTAGVSTDYLLKGGETPAQLHPADHVRAALQALQALPQYPDLPTDLKRRYRDLLSYIGVQMRRLVFDAERALMDMHTQRQGMHLDHEEFRRRWLDSQEDD